MFRFIKYIAVVISLAFLPTKLFAAYSDSLSMCHFGPNALPIVDIHDGETSDKLLVETSVSYFKGFKDDYSLTPHLRLVVPLFSRWVNLESWTNLVDIYHIPILEKQDNYKKASDSTFSFGDIYISTNIQVMHHSWCKYIPDAVVRIGLKTATGGTYEQRRFYDNIAYFFDLNIGKSIEFKNSWAQSFRLVASVGFLCWQTDISTQNDAYTYGLKAKFDAKYFSPQLTWSGYSGWMNLCDRPMSLKAKVNFPIENWSPFIAYQYGIRDYQYHEFKIGLSYSFKVINRL